jgi:HAD superfamily hydrolase (TIGR01662 family)
VRTTTVVVPTVGRPSLGHLLRALDAQETPVDAPVVLVDDRPGNEPLDLPSTGLDVSVVRSGGGGPARARNLGWRRARTRWVSFVDDDVLPPPTWYGALLEDLAAAGSDVAGVQGQVQVPLPTGRRPTDWERGTAGLENGVWITADLTYRRDALVAVGGFDERFPRAFREDADLGLRVSATQGRIVRGHRHLQHPVRPARWSASLSQQRGNADDFLMRALHGPDWAARARAPRGRRRRHVAVAGAGLAAVAGVAIGHHRLAGLALLGWAAGTGELAARRIAPGPRDAAEVTRMVATSALIPFAATWHSARGALLHRSARPWVGLPDLVLFDRDGTLVHDVPYNGDPALVRPVQGAREALDRLRHLGVRVGLVTNQSGIASGRITAAQAQSVNDRVEELLGPLDVVEVCPHGPGDGCACRKPAPGMVKAACAELGVDPAACVVVGDIGSDVEAAAAAGAASVLVPTGTTRSDEVEAATLVAADLAEAVDLVCTGRWRGDRRAGAHGSRS